MSKWHQKWLEGLGGEWWKRGCRETAAEGAVPFPDNNDPKSSTTTVAGWGFSRPSERCERRRPSRRTSPAHAV